MKKFYSILAIAGAITLGNAQIVINEVYGGGGNSGATYKNDFVELINKGTASVTLTGATLQYASAAGTFNQYHPLPNITLAPGQKYLIQEQAGASGTTDLAPDYVAPIPTNFGSGTNSVAGFAMAAAAGKIALVSDANQISTVTASNVLDFVGYGTTANQFEGSGAAPAPSATLSVSRTNGIDTNNNAADFTVGAPTPQNSATMGVDDLINTKEKVVLSSTNFSDNVSVLLDGKSEVEFYSANGQLVKKATVNANEVINTSELQKGFYIIKVVNNGSVYNKKVIKK